MPFTPYHWGPSSWLGLLLYKFIDFPTLLIASVIIDVEGFCVLVFKLNYSLHGYQHTFIGATISAVLLALLMYKLKPITMNITKLLKIPQNFGFSTILISALLGAWLHVIFDSFLYGDMMPFYPSKNNPFIKLFSLRDIYAFCEWSFIVGIILYFIIVLVNGRKKTQLDKGDK